MSFMDCLDDPLHRQMYAYWQSKRRRRRMPRRSDIDPTEIPRLLPNILISEMVSLGGRERCRYRLAGTAIVRAFGKDPTGHYLDEITNGAYRDFIEGIHRMVRVERRPLFCESEYTGLRGLHMAAKRLLLPVSEDEVTVKQIFSVLVFRFGAAPAAVIELDHTEGTTRHAPPVLAEI